MTWLDSEDLIALGHFLKDLGESCKRTGLDVTAETDDRGKPYIAAWNDAAIIASIGMGESGTYTLLEVMGE